MAAGPIGFATGCVSSSTKVRLFARTAFDFTVHPRRFAREWVAGARHALNPLGFLATAFAVVAPCDALFAHFVHEQEASLSLWQSALGSILPFGYYLLVGALQHAVLYAFGARRPLRDSCAMALYAGGGPATAARLAMRLIALVVYARLGTTNVEHLNSAPAVLLFFGATLSFTMIVTGFLFGWLHPPGSYGLHLELGVHPHAHHWGLSVDLSD